MLQKLKLFESKREWGFFFGFIFFVFAINFTLKYHTYSKIKSQVVYQTKAKVVNQYQKTKHNKTYTVFKLQSEDGFTFYTTSREDLKDLYADTLLLKLFTKNITLLDMFKGFYAPTFDIRIWQKDRFKDFLVEKISSQHHDKLTKELFLALFLAKPISKDLRDKVTTLGISHLIAISGFHLGVLFFILYFVFKIPYRFLQDRYFPYRNRKTDLSIMIISILFGYLYLLGFVPSLVRSYVMMVVLFYLYDRYFEVISFEVLLIAVLLILSFIPSFFFSIGFWFSVSGVFFIYLFLKLFPKLKPWQTFLFLNIWVFIMMIPIVHIVFSKWTYLQLISPLLSILFTIFYPLELFLHLVGYGGLLDSMILKLLSLNSEVYHFYIGF